MGVLRLGGNLLHVKACSPGRAEGSLHGKASSLRRTEYPLHVCTSQGCRFLYIYWSHGPQIVHFDNLGSLAQKSPKMALRIIHFDNLGSLAQKCSKWAPNRPWKAYRDLVADFPEVHSVGVNFKFPGRGQRETPVTDARSRLRPISHRKLHTISHRKGEWLLAYFQIGCLLLTLQMHPHRSFPQNNTHSE